MTQGTEKDTATLQRVEEAPVTEPGGDQTDEIRRLNETWEGRLRTEQAATRARYDAMDAQLAPRAQRVDRETGLIVFTTPETPEEPTTQPEPVGDEEFDPYDSDGVLRPDFRTALEKLADARANERIRAVLGPIVPTLDGFVETTVRQQYPDWDGIKDDVTANLKKWGFTSLMHAQSMGMMEDAVYAARGKRASSGAPATPSPGPSPQSEADRVAALAAGSAVGGPGPRPAAPGPTSELSPEERAQIEASGMTIAEYEELTSGQPVTLKRKEGTK